jgi:hypothetical protein
MKMARFDLAVDIALQNDDSFFWGHFETKFEMTTMNLLNVLLRRRRRGWLA